MSVLEVLTFPDPRLRKVSQPLKEVTAKSVRFAKDLVDTMYVEKGIGLSAPQVNRLERIICVDTRPRDKEGRYEITEMTELEQNLSEALKFPLVLFNPVVIGHEGSTSYDEGCLSVPGFYETVKRYDKISVEALSLAGDSITFEIDGLTSICIQHEIDHLDGKLFIDRLSLIKSNKIKNKIKKFGYPSKDSDEDDDELES